MKKTLCALVLLVSSLFATGCSRTPIIETKFIERPALKIADPMPLDLLPMRWVLLTDNNYEAVIESIKTKNQVVFLVALDEQGYKALAINNANVLKFIRDQKTIINAYREYYENGR